MSTDVRREIRDFAEQMELKLRKHDLTRGYHWKGRTVESLLADLEEHVRKLRHDVAHPIPGRLGMSAADVGNLAMMVSGVCGALGDREVNLPAAPQPAPVADTCWVKALPPGVRRWNGGVECDLERGPCACGAWHKPGQDVVGQESPTLTGEAT